MRPLAEAEPLIAALDRFGDLYQSSLVRRFCWRLGVAAHGDARDVTLVEAAERILSKGNTGPDAFFFAHRGGRAASGDMAEALSGYEPIDDSHEYWRGAGPQTMLIDDVEAIWEAIDKRDDWQMLHDKVAALRAMGAALGEPPSPAGIVAEG